MLTEKQTNLRARQRLEITLGKELAARYEDIEALLALIDYRLDEAAGNYRYGLFRLFEYDTYLGKKHIIAILAWFFSPFLWIVAYVKYLFRNNAATRLVFSKTFLRNRRYPVAREQVEEKYGCTAIVSFVDMMKSTRGNARQSIKETFSADFGQYRPIFLFRSSVSGIDLKTCVKQYYNIIFEEKNNRITPDSEQLEKALVKLRKAYFKRIEYLTGVLRYNKIELYTTVNQYNLRDLLIIHACDSLGIRTLQLEHHAMQFSRSKFDVEDPIYRISFVSECAVWSESELQFHNKVFHYENLINKQKNSRLIISGNPELSYEQAVALQKKYPVQRKLTFMTSSAGEYDPETKLDEYTQWRWSIYSGLHELSIRQKIQICVRYTPFKEFGFREKEIPILTEWGFQVSDSVPENLMEDLCSSMAVMSSTSSVLATARALGKLVYRVEDTSIDYIQVDRQVHDIRVQEIPNIVIPEYSLQQIEKSSFFDIDRLIGK